MQFIKHHPKKIFLFTILVFVGIVLFFNQSLAITLKWENPAKAETIQELIDAILSFMVIIAIPVSVIFLIISGLKFFTAQGNSTQITSAKKTFLWTIIGIAILIGAKVISATITKFFETKGWSLIVRVYAANSSTSSWEVPNLTPFSSITDFVNAIGSFLLGVAMPISIIAVIWTGVRFLLAQGNSTKISNAKKGFVLAILGLALVIGAYAIVQTIKTVI